MTLAACLYFQPVFVAVAQATFTQRSDEGGGGRGLVKARLAAGTVWQTAATRLP